MIPSIQKNFASEGRPSWEPLSDFTIDTRTRAGFGAGPILKRKGMLARVAAQLNIWTITSQQAHVDWSNQARARYGPIHQNGARFTTRIRGINPAGLAALSKIKMFAGTKSVTKGSGTIPARPFLLIQDEDVPKIEHVFLNWVEERLNRTGFSLATNAAGALIKTAL
jgi:phage gpG-like protein